MRTPAHPLWLQCKRILALAVLGLAACASEVVRDSALFRQAIPERLSDEVFCPARNFRSERRCSAA